MIIMYGDVFNSDCDYIGITTNSIVKRNGELVMGAGNAKVASAKFKHLPKFFGDRIVKDGLVGKFYGIIKCGKYFAFQTKRHWKDGSDMQDVIRSINILKRGAEKYPNKVFGLPFPAINNGGLCWRYVIKYLKDLPDNVIVYHLEYLK